MQETLTLIGMICAVGAGVFFVASAVMFFNFHIPELWADRKSGSFASKQIEEIRMRNNASANQRRRMNVFEDLEKKAKVKKPNTHSINAGTSGGLANAAANPGTTALSRGAKPVNPDFIIEKNVMFVSTSEVL